MIEPVDPLEGGEFDGFDMSPRTFASDYLCFEETDHGLRERVEAPMCQEMGLGRCHRRLTRMMIMEERLIDLACHKSFKTPDDVLFTETF